MNLVDSLDAVGLSQHDRRVLVERGLDLGKDLRVKWSAYEKETKKCTLWNSNDGGRKGEEWVAHLNSKFLQLSREAATVMNRISCSQSGPRCSSNFLRGRLLGTYSARPVIGSDAPTHK